MMYRPDYLKYPLECTLKCSFTMFAAFEPKITGTTDTVSDVNEQEKGRNLSLYACIND